MSNLVNHYANSLNCYHSLIVGYHSFKINYTKSSSVFLNLLQHVNKLDHCHHSSFQTVIYSLSASDLVKGALPPTPPPPNMYNM